jgi:hypothetical protein
VEASRSAGEISGRAGTALAAASPFCYQPSPGSSGGESRTIIRASGLIMIIICTHKHARTHTNTKPAIADARGVPRTNLAFVLALERARERNEPETGSQEAEVDYQFFFEAAARLRGGLAPLGTKSLAGHARARAYSRRHNFVRPTGSSARSPASAGESPAPSPRAWRDCVISV